MKNLSIRGKKFGRANAWWLITWETAGDIEGDIAAILSSRKSEKTVKDLVEFLYLRATSTVAELASYANNPKNIPYKAGTVEMINEVPHGGRIICGDNPHLYARTVTELKIAVDHEIFKETISWKEPDNWKFKDKQRRIPERAQEGERNSYTRDLSEPLGKDIIWTRKVNKIV